MSFPDRPQFEKLSESLWERFPDGRAAVMIGSGFSMNAEPLPGVSGNFPSWAKLASAMTDRLHSKEASTVEFPKSFLKMASEYEAEFGPTDLNRLIASEIPDQDFAPSRLHLRLLELPWVDVFTTNYDTLLERTHVQKRAYHLVTKPDDLAKDRGPRIIKLHGSFPSQTPFIVTEEHFRTYPRKFAPFVNTVQQSLLENAFLLLGFSGEDPNFLAWIGWVRDQIGDAHCPIYLCGVLNLTSAEKRLFESRGIKLIDLSPIVSHIQDTGKRHRIALEWAVEQLHLAEPQSPEDWPETSNKRLLDWRADLPSPLESRSSNPADSKLTFPQTNEEVDTFIRKWAYERISYPQWVVPPESIRENLWDETARFIPWLQDFTQKWSLGARLEVAQEIEWRVSTALGFYHEMWLENITQLLDEFFDTARDQTDFPAPELHSKSLSQHRVNEAVSMLVLSVLRDARRSFDFDKWEHWASRFAKFCVARDESNVALDYEKALCALWRGKRISARSIVAGFADCNSPHDKMKKASLHAELDDLDAAKRLAELALIQIRDGLRNRGDSIELLSLEGWCLFLILNFTISTKASDKEPQRREYRKRWRELRAYLCDPWAIKEGLEEKLTHEVPSEFGGISETHDFDPFRLNVTQRWKADTISQFLPAYSYLSIFEIVGIPLRTSPYTLAGDAFIAAVRWVASVEKGWIRGVFLRRGNVKNFKKADLLTRCDVALMERGAVDNLYRYCSEAFDEIIGASRHVRNLSPGDIDTLSMAVEILSRLAFRLSPEKLCESFQRCLTLHRCPGVPSHIILHDLGEPWFERLVYCAPSHLWGDWVDEVLSTPAFDKSSNGAVPEAHRWTDPITHFDLNLTGAALPPREGGGNLDRHVIQHFGSAEIEVGELRNRIVSRLIRFHIWGLLSVEEDGRLGSLIWTVGGVTADLPRCSGFTLCSFLTFPAPPGVDVKQQMKNAFAKHELGSLVETVIPDNAATIAKKVGSHLKDLSDITVFPRESSHKDEHRVRWNASEARQLAEISLTWWSKLTEILRQKGWSSLGPMDEFFSRNTLIHHIKILRRFLSRVAIPYLKPDTDQLAGLVEAFDGTDEFCPPSLEFNVSLLATHPSRREAMAKGISAGLHSNSHEEFEDAVQAVTRWSDLRSCSTSFPELPDEFVRTLVDHVAFRREPFVGNSFSFFKIILHNGIRFISAADVHLLIRSMDAWEFSTRLDQNSHRPPFEQAQNLDLRTRVAGLLTALLKIAEPDDLEKLWEIGIQFQKNWTPEIRDALG